MKATAVERTTAVFLSDWVLNFSITSNRRHKEIVYIGMSGCMLSANANQRPAPRYFFVRTRVTANTQAKADRFRGFRYWSTIYRSVPATGNVSNAAIRATPAQRALALGTNRPLNSQHASRKRKIETPCHSSSPASNGRGSTRNEKGRRFGKKRSLAW